jgi:hypothetical protein
VKAIAPADTLQLRPGSSATLRSAPAQQALGAMLALAMRHLPPVLTIA